MTDIRNKKYRRGIVAAFAAAFLTAGCSESEESHGSSLPDGTPVEVTLELSAPYNQAPSLSSRGDGIPANPEMHEKIGNWFLVFVDRAGIVRKILRRTDTETGINTINNPVEAETFKCVLPSGTYSVYAFANLTPEELALATGLSFNIGNPVSYAQCRDAVWNDARQGVRRLNLWNIKDEYIPMSGYHVPFKVQNTIEETISIEVVRMMAKVELKFSNPTDADITVNSVGFDPVTQSCVALYPLSMTDGKPADISYGILGNSAYSPLDDAIYGKVEYDLKPAANTDVSPFIVAKKTDEKVGERSCSFYIKESISDHHNDGAFTVWLNVTHDGGNRESIQHNITSDIRGYINRNDWIVIPITLSQYDVSVEALFYPPIGGYPAVLSSTDPDGSQVFTFGTQGEFAIVPYVTDKLSGLHLAPSEYSIEIGDIAGDDIFEDNKSPEITHTSASLPDEITGTLSTAAGKAKVEVKVSIGAQTYTRCVYIIRENNAES